MDVYGILDELKSMPWYKGQIIHVERSEARRARFAEPEQPLPPPIRRILTEQGISSLYSHQVEAIDHVSQGRNVVVVTGTASGKSLCYQVPALRLLLEDPEARCLFLFPTKALAQDQLKKIERMLALLPGDRERIAGCYDGDTPSPMRRRLRDRGRVILTNPDMLHASVFSHHSRWAGFFRNLRLIVVDELHTYAGLFGSHVANLFQRLWRICNFYESSPRVLACTATIANPKEHAERLIGRKMELVNRDGSPRGERTYVFWNPPFAGSPGRYARVSANDEAARIMACLVRRGISTIAFSKARVTAELINRYVSEYLERIGSSARSKVTPYRGGYLPEERREIERKLFSGELLGVSSTAALELGIDVGDLEAAVIVGYPGRRANFFQQAGRAGRRDRDSLVFLVALGTVINQYVMRHPSYIFGRSIEHAVMDAENPYVVCSQLRCAAAELPLAEEEEAAFGNAARVSLEVLEEKGKVRRLEGKWYHASPEIPHHEVSLRAFSEGMVMIVDAENHEAVIGTVDRYDSQPIVHPGAIYMHQGETYEVDKLDLERNLAFVRKVNVNYFTDPLGGTDVDHVDQILRERELGSGKVFFGEVTSYFRTYAYVKVRFYELEAMSFHEVDLPVEWLETMAFWIEPPEGLMAEVYEAGLDAFSGMRGVGYATRMSLPLFVLAETLDFSHTVGSRNTPWHTVFIYERHPHGLGYVEKAYEILEEILEATFERIRECDCRDGCPCCVGKPLRGYTTWNVDRGEGSIPSRSAALHILSTLLGKGVSYLPTVGQVKGKPSPFAPASRPESPETPRKELSLRMERGLRRRLERQRDAKILHRIDPVPEKGYAVRSHDDPSIADSAKRVAHRISHEREERKKTALEKKAVEPKELPKKIEDALPPEPSHEPDTKHPEAQAREFERMVNIASRARKRARDRRKESS